MPFHGTRYVIRYKHALAGVRGLDRSRWRRKDLGVVLQHYGVRTPWLDLITYEAQLPAAGPRWQGFRRLRDGLSGWIARRFALSNDPPTAIGHRAQAEDYM